MAALQTHIEKAVRGPTVGIVIIAFAATVWLLDFAQDVLIPLAVAILVWALINALASALARLPLGPEKVRSWVSMTLAIVMVLAALYFVGGLITDNAAQIRNNANMYQENVERLLPAFSTWFGVEADLASLLDQINFGSVLGGVALALSTLVGSAIIILIYVTFLLVEQSTFDKKLSVLFQEPKRRADIQHLSSMLSRRIREYLWVKTLMSLLTASISYGVLWYLDVDFASFWAFLIFLLNYVPTIGSILGIIFPAVQVLVQFGDPMLFLGVVVVLGLVPQFTIGNIVEPKVMSTSLNLSPIVILVSLAFWGIIWGIAGLFLAVPITVILMIICAHFEPTRWVAVLLSSNGEIVQAVEHDPV